jgi:hypothetical protein
MSFNVGMMVLSGFMQMQGRSAQASAQAAQANAIERQTYDEMKRAQLGALQDHNRRVESFAEYEESVLLASRGRQDRSVQAILKAGKQKSREELSSARVVALGQQSMLARRGDVARADRAAAYAGLQQDQMGTMLNLGMKLYQVTGGIG